MGYHEDGREGGEEEEGRRRRSGRAPKVRTPHKDVGKKKQRERERTISPQNELIIFGGVQYIVLRIIRHTPYHIVCHNLTLSACQMISKDLPKTTV